MMRKIKITAVAVLMAMLAISCTHEQTTLSLEDIPSRVSVIGKLIYVHTVIDDGSGEVVNKYFSASGRKVFVEIENSYFDSQAQGITVFQTITDSVGNYKLEIPILNSDMQVTITAEPFLGKISFNDQMITNMVPTYKKREVLYHYSTVKTLSRNSITLADVEYLYDFRYENN